MVIFLTSGGTKFTNPFFLNFSRLLQKDEIKKGSFTATFFTGGVLAYCLAMVVSELTIGDYGAALVVLKLILPTGEYGLLYTSSASTIPNGRQSSGASLLSSRNRRDKSDLFFQTAQLAYQKLSRMAVHLALSAPHMIPLVPKLVFKPP